MKCTVGVIRQIINIIQERRSEFKSRGSYGVFICLRDDCVFHGYRRIEEPCVSCKHFSAYKVKPIVTKVKPLKEL